MKIVEVNLIKSHLKTIGEKIKEEVGQEVEEGMHEYGAYDVASDAVDTMIFNLEEILNELTNN